MQFFTRIIHGFRAEARMHARALGSPWLAALLTLLVLLLVLAAQLPLRYHIEVGREEGYGGDLPLITGFFPFEPEEKNSALNWRWTTERAQVLFPGVGARPLLVTIRMLSVNTEVAAKGAQQFVVWANGQQLAVFPTNPNGGTFSFLVPPSNDWRGDSGFEIRNATFVPAGDERAIGIPVDALSIGAPGGPSLPPLGSITGWLGAALLAWLAVCRAGFRARTTFVLLAPCVLLLAIAATLDPPRTAFGAMPAIVALAWSLGLVIVLAHAIPPLSARLAVPLGEEALRWLLLLSLLAFTLRYGGKLYPYSMWGDLGFHTNRFLEVAQGRVLLLSRNRGVDFPYPPALYLLIAPFTLLGVSPRTLLPFIGALLDALSLWLVYTIGVLVYPAQRAKTQAWAVAAAALYSLCAATFMTMWWGFSTHIFAQFAHLLLVAAIVLLVPRMLNAQYQQRFGTHASVLALLFCVVFLGHFGFWINMSVLGTIGVAMLVLGAMRQRVPWRVVWAVGFAFAAAEAISVAGFYSAYSGLFLAQAQAAREGGLTGMAGRLPTPPDVLWRGLWYDGFRTHFGFFPIPLAILGVILWLASRRKTRATPVVLTLAIGTFVIAAGFAVLPFLSGSTLSTRWLMFSAWAVAIATMYVVQATWRFGWAVRVGYALMACYILWITASVWLGALAYRIRPPEPF